MKNPIRELNIEYMAGFREIFRMDVTDLEFILAQNC